MFSKSGLQFVRRRGAGISFALALGYLLLLLPVLLHQHSVRAVAAPSLSSAAQIAGQTAASQAAAPDECLLCGLLSQAFLAAPVLTALLLLWLRHDLSFTFASRTVLRSRSRRGRSRAPPAFS